MNLQGACWTVVLFEPAANTNLEIQAIGRVRRTGQKNPQVVYRLIVEGTFNEYQEIKQLEKRLGEMATWGGNDVQEALSQFVSGDDALDLDDDGAYFTAIKRFDRHIKGQTRSRKLEKLRLLGLQAPVEGGDETEEAEEAEEGDDDKVKVIPFEQVEAMRKYRDDLRKRATAV